MTFISYAQNFEDIMLWRALKHIKNGFYIDVGAWSPDIDSVTKAFYESGWSGINIEPNPDYVKLYDEKRKRDINLVVAVGDTTCEAEMYFNSNSGLSSLDKKIADANNSELGCVSVSAKVEIITLKQICEENCLNKDIHFLKVDVEGFEERVLKGNDWLKFRPWVVVVEATLPMSKIENYEDWEPILLNVNYSLAYADGLNRFYVSSEHQELLSAFRYPPNVFDDFKLMTLMQAEAEAKQAEVKAKQAGEKVGQLSTELHMIYMSRSWRIVASLRRVVYQVRLVQKWIKKNGVIVLLVNYLKKTIKKILILLKHYANSNPKFKNKLLVFLNRVPGLTGKLVQLTRPASTGSAIVSSAQLSLSAKNIYEDLKKKIAQNKGLK